jgi:exopolysaccharide biosynthesis protein
MLEFAEAMVELGAEGAINLDGGGSTTLVHPGHLLNRPYSSQDQPAPASRRVLSASAIEHAQEDE